MSEAAQKTLTDALGFQPGTVLRAYGMRRSGNHAVINWLQRNASGRSVFLNNCAVGRPARRTWRSVEVDGRRINVQKGEPITPMTQDVGDGAVVILSYEDFSPDPDDLAAGLTADLPDSDVTHEILIYRNFMNWTASLLRKIQANDDLDSLVCLRIMMVALDKYRDILDLVANAQNLGMVPINYDRWIARPVYREKLLKAFALPCEDNTLGEVQRYGGGSSFQKGVTDARQLNANDRWREMANDPSFQIVLLAASQDEALVTLMQKLMPKDAELLANYLEQAQFPYVVQVGEK